MNDILDLVLAPFARCWPGVICGAVLGLAAGAMGAGFAVIVAAAMVGAFAGAGLAASRDPIANRSRLLKTTATGFGACGVLAVFYLAYLFWAVLALVVAVAAGLLIFANL